MISVFILVDALGWELIRERDFVSDLLPCRRELETVFGFSSAAIPSILTGLWPREHGRWNLYYYHPEGSPFRWAKPLGALPNGLADHRVVRKAVSVIGRKVSRTGGYFQIYGIPVKLLPYFDVCEKRNIYSPLGMAPARSVFDEMESGGVAYRVYSYHDYSDQGAVEQCVKDIRSREAGFYFVYLSELDAFLHHHVAEPGPLNAELNRYARHVRRISEAALEAEPEASVYVFSDHGMTPIHETCDLMGAIEGLGYEAPRDYIALYDSTMARFWFFNQKARSGITRHLGEMGAGGILEAGERRALGIDFPNHRFGELIFLLRPGCVIHPSHMGRTPWKGMHGFHPRDRHSSAALLARRETPVPVSGIRDLYALMRHEAGIGR